MAFPTWTPREHDSAHAILGTAGKQGSPDTAVPHPFTTGQVDTYSYVNFRSTHVATLCSEELTTQRQV